MTTIYYKTTDAGGASFGAPEVTWRVGRITRDPLPAPMATGLCTGGLLHAATVPTESLVSRVPIDIRDGFRLFTVEPRGEVVIDAAHPHKVGCRAWKVTGELEAWQALGPQGRQVLEVVERAGRLTDDERTRLSVQHDAFHAAAQNAARNAAQNAAQNAAWRAAWRASRYAAWNAVLALVAWDLCDKRYTREMRDQLIESWREVIGLPEGVGC